MKKKILIPVICIILSVISGIITKDLLVGGTTLVTGLLCAYYASEGKRVNYIFGLINCILIGYISYKNNLYGLFFFNIFVCAPLQINGYLSWNKYLNKENNVKVRGFTLKNSIIITLSCVIGSFLLGLLLSIIPNQNLAFMDASSNCINLCGIILMNLRFKECWWVWIINNTIDLVIWIFMVISSGTGAVMMLLVSLGYLLINIYGIIKWNIAEKKS